ncbi:hypothetical protein, partial [Pseudomonas sp. WS 5011]|uniref:hypothetical protein n=1 Tax=Pseudomonas sp. WS 5011 TaxID=2717477 RepID=UPI001CB7084B
RDRLFRNRLEIGHVDSEMSGHALAKWPVTIYRNDRSRWAEIRTHRPGAVEAGFYRAQKAQGRAIAVMR